MGGSFLHYVYGGVVGLLFGIVTVNVFGFANLFWAWGIALGALMLILAAITWIPLSGGVAQVIATPSRRRNLYALNAVAAHLIFGYLVSLITGDFSS